MAKYCAKCGRTLPDGVEVCSVCAAAESTKSEAAPFTRLTSETEVWKDNSRDTKKRRTPLRERFSTNKLVALTTIIVVLVLGALAFVMTRPAIRVNTAINSGDYAKAQSLYFENYSAEQAPMLVCRKLQKTAQRAYSDLMDDSITAEEGEQIFAMLFNFTTADAVINGVYEDYGKLVISRETAANAALSESNGDYLAAADLYKLVIPEDSRYTEAQEACARCLERYAAQIVSSARQCVDEDDYEAAIVVLEQGDNELQSRDTFSPAIDEFLESCFSQYEKYIISESKNLAELEEYENAAALIDNYLTGHNRESEVLSEAYKEYAHLAQKKVISNAVSKSNEFYESQSYAEAFAELDLIAEDPEYAEVMEVPVSDLEKRFVEDIFTKASTTFDGDVLNAEEAAKIVEEALKVRKLPKLEAYYEYLDNLIPLDLNVTMNIEKQGVIYRNTNEFECVDGTDYTDGWMWGENYSSVTYKLDGQYNTFSGVFAVRRAEGAQKQANFDVWLDGVLAYTSDILYATESKMPIEVDVTGAKEMKIVFYANYKTSGTQGGYCCHGLCSPIAAKIPEPFVYEEE